MSYNGADLIFPHLGIVIQNMYNHITLPGGFTIAYYGIIIGIGMLLALLVIEHDAARHGRDTGLYYDFFLIAITLGVVGARIYYVIFQWEYYRGIFFFSFLRVFSSLLILLGSFVQPYLNPLPPLPLFFC